MKSPVPGKKSPAPLVAVTGQKEREHEDTSDNCVAWQARRSGDAMQMEIFLCEGDMSARLWMPLYIGDYKADTAHLSTYEHGAYLLLLMHHWQHDRLPGDDAQLARIAGVHPPHWPKVKRVLISFFDVQEDGSWTQKRLLKELAKSEEISNKRKAAAEQMLKRRRANAEQMLTQSQSQSQSHKKEDIESASLGSAPTKGSRLSEDWQPSPDNLSFAESEGFSASEINLEAAKFRDYWVGRAGAGGVKRNWSATWRNWIRKSKEGRRNGRYVQDDKSASAAAKRLAELAERGRFTFGPRPSLLPAQGGNGIRLLPEGCGE
jgi:uncharacterized protein YdaU (DUF1376 family)